MGQDYQVIALGYAALLVIEPFLYERDYDVRSKMSDVRLFFFPPIFLLCPIISFLFLH